MAWYAFFAMNDATDLLRARETTCQVMLRYVRFRNRSVPKLDSIVSEKNNQIMGGRFWILLPPARADFRNQVRT